MGKQKPCTMKLLSYLLRTNMETYYPYTLLCFANQKKKKKCEFEVLVNENYKYINLQIIPFL